ncbi:MAG TPA: hypothetical protein VGC11_01820, partial [Acidimicrobiia bacterium]
DDARVSATAYSPLTGNQVPADVVAAGRRTLGDVGLADRPSPAADWIVGPVSGAETFTFGLLGKGADETAGHIGLTSVGIVGAQARLELVDRVLVVGEGGKLALADGEISDGTPLALELLAGGPHCATFPEVEVNVAGEPPQATDLGGDARGWVDAHVHMMAYEFLGGRARCGRPWHRYGVTEALLDCPDHEPGGAGGVLEAFLRAGQPVAPHDTTGWPTFGDWPAYNSLTHEQMYYRWLERAWRGGLRIMTDLLVENAVLCEVYPLKQNSCDEMASVRLQALRAYQLQDYIDAQHGGPDRGWFRIVTSPQQARQAVNGGRLAVVLGIEVSEVFGCRERFGRPECTEEIIDTQIEEVYDLGVRQMELVNKFDNALSGVAGDSGTVGPIVNLGNFYATGSWWQMEQCDEEQHGDDDHGHDNTQPVLPGGQTDRDTLAGGVLHQFAPAGALPLYEPGPHCNARGLTDLGAHTVQRLAERGILIDPDHMSTRARHESLDLIGDLGYPGILSSHGWADDAAVRRIYSMGGFVTPYAGGSSGFLGNWRQHREWADERFPEDGYFAFGYGADTNGFGSQGGPRNPANGVDYGVGFPGLDGTVTVHQQVSGERRFDVNTDGVAHYGLYPDWMEDLRLQMQAGEELLEDMARGAEAYLRLWDAADSWTPLPGT